MNQLLFLTGILVSVTACASGSKPPPTPKLPYPAWYVSLVAPRHMEVWVESVDVLDQRGLAFYRVHGGVLVTPARSRDGQQKAGEENL